MDKVRGEYSDDFIEKLTEEFLTGGLAGDNVERVRSKIKEVRMKNHHPIFLEMQYAALLVRHEDTHTAIHKLQEVIDLDEQVYDLASKELRLADLQIEFFSLRASSIAQKGGMGRSAKYKILEEETIRLYKGGTWKSVPQAAAEITPQIVNLSRNGNGDLMSTTTKPLEWIRSYVKSKK